MQQVLALYRSDYIAHGGDLLVYLVARGWDVRHIAHVADRARVFIVTLDLVTGVWNGVLLCSGLTSLLSLCRMLDVTFSLERCQKLLHVELILEYTKLQTPVSNTLGSEIDVAAALVEEGPESGLVRW